MYVLCVEYSCHRLSSLLVSSLSYSYNSPISSSFLPFSSLSPPFPSIPPSQVVSGMAFSTARTCDLFSGAQQRDGGAGGGADGEV